MSDPQFTPSVFESRGGEIGFGDGRIGLIRGTDGFGDAASGRFSAHIIPGSAKRASQILLRVHLSRLLGESTRSRATR
jgi:hypothetical protein